MNQTFDNYVHCLLTTLTVIRNTNPELTPSLIHSGKEDLLKGFLSPAVCFCLLAYTLCWALLKGEIRWPLEMITAKLLTSLPANQQMKFKNYQDCYPHLCSNLIFSWKFSPSTQQLGNRSKIFCSKPTQAFPSAAPQAELQISEEKSHALPLQTH